MPGARGVNCAPISPRRGRAAPITTSDPGKRGLDFTEPDADILADFHGSPEDPKLSLFFGGNYYFATAELVDAFEKLHPQFKGHIYWETIPPGLLVQQIKAGGAITVGNMTWTVKPDVYFAGLKKIKQYVDEGMLEPPAVPYVTNTLTIMVRKGNPAHVTGLERPRQAADQAGHAQSGL